MKRLQSVVILILLTSNVSLSTQEAEQHENCLESTRPHLSRCDQYFRCTVLPNEAHVWVPTQCQKGLVYMQNLGTCVVPDSDWECDLSAENEHDHSDENVYGIDNLSSSLAAVIGTTISSNHGEERSSDFSQPRDSSPEFSEIESSGDGSTERPANESSAPTIRVNSNSEKKASKFVTQSPIPSGVLDQSQLDAFLAYYDTQSGLKTTTRKPPLNEKNHLEHLKEIIKQQNQLNRMGNQIADTITVSRKPVGHPEKAVADNQTPIVEISSGMEDIIRSILQISQQAISNQKSSPVDRVPPSAPIVNPIYIPIMQNPVQESAGPLMATKDRSTTNTAMANNQTPNTMGLFNTENNAMYNAFRNQPVNESTMYDRSQQVLYDAYGNRFVPKDTYQMEPSSDPMFGYNPYTGVSQTAPVMNRLAANFLSNNLTPYGVPQRVNTQPSTGSMMAQQQQLTSFTAPSHTSDSFDKLSEIIERIKQLDAIDSSERNENDENVSENDPPEEDPNESGENSEEDDFPRGPTSKLKRKLFSLGDTTFDYDQYKDSMLPLVKANPNDDRISVVTCMVGSRQPNKTDCFRYYICNPHNGVFQSYNCPSYTAFNKNSRMCDMASYKPCKAKTSPPVTVRPLKAKKGSSSQHGINQLKNELRTAQKYVNLIRQEAEKLRFHNTMQSSAPKIIFLPSTGFPNSDSLSSKAHRRPSPGKRKPSVTTSAPVSKKTKPTRTVPRCRLEGRMPDPMDHTNYFVCHRKSPKKFIKLKMACPGSLIYCAASQYCTVTTNC